MKKLFYLFTVLVSIAAIAASLITQAPGASAYGGHVWSGRQFIENGSSATSRSYFENGWYSSYREVFGSASDVIHGGVPSYVDTVDEFVDFIISTYNLPASGGRNHSSKVGAAFLIHTMLGRNGDSANANGGRWSIKQSDFEEVRNRMKGLTINWWEGRNTWGQTTMSVINNARTAYDVQRPRNAANEWKTTITMRDSAGNVVYVIDRACVNPVGATAGLPISWEVQAKSYTKKVTSSAPLGSDTGYVESNLTAKPGDTISYKHSLRAQGASINRDVHYVVRGSGFPSSYSSSGDPTNYVRGSVRAPIGSGTTFVNIGAHRGGTNGNKTVRTLTQDDVGNNLCQRIEYVPANSSGATSNTPNRCVNVPYNYNLIPSITNVPSIIEPGNPITGITGNVGNSGPTKSRPTDVRYIRIVQKVGQSNPSSATGGTSASSIAPCQFYGMGGSNASRCSIINPNMGTSSPKGSNYVFSSTGDSIPGVNDTIPDGFDVGDRVCYGLSVTGYNAATGSGKTGWRHSALRCIVLGKRPKIHATGGDVIARGSSGDVTTSVTRYETKTFGSWSEYGIMATGEVTGMASGAGYAGGISSSAGSDPCGLSLLTFANRSTPGAMCLHTSMGGYTLSPVVRTIADRYAMASKVNMSGKTINLASLSSGVYTPSNASRDINLTSSGEIDRGRSVVIYAPTKDIRILGNINYTEKDLSKLTDIPQVIIIARNITISSGVTNVDSWLVAKTSGHGNIYTCNEDPDNLRSTNCRNRLTINGPTISNKLHLLRTAGANAGDEASTPAEVFNLRPDAYLWGLAQGNASSSVPTTLVKDLPPRF